MLWVWVLAPRRGRLGHAVVHRSTCRYSQRRRPLRNRVGWWMGPFASRRVAELAIDQVAVAFVRDCRRCQPGDQATMALAADLA